MQFGSFISACVFYEMHSATSSGSQQLLCCLDRHPPTPITTGLCQPEYLPVLDDLLAQYPLMPRATVFDIFAQCQVPHIKDDGTKSNCPA